jgi:hypothetical protein
MTAKALPSSGVFVISVYLGREVSAVLVSSIVSGLPRSSDIIGVGRHVSMGANERTRSRGRASSARANYFDTETGEWFWISGPRKGGISGPRKEGKDRLYFESSALIEIDPDVAEEYWRDIKGTRSE